MNHKENLATTGQVKIEIKKADGTVETIKHHNKVVQTGLNHIAALLQGATNPAAMSHMAVGEGTTTEDGTRTSLVDQKIRVAFDEGSPTISANTVTYTASFGPQTDTTPDFALTEAGIFNEDGTSGDMLCRVTFPVVTKQYGDSITITWAVTIS
jgi:hypothetical protein